MPSIGRRRVPGLRREEVAQLAGISTAWYTLLETGANIRVSPRVVERVAAALGLSEEEKLHLFSLAIVEMPTVARTTGEEVGSTGREYFELIAFTRRARSACSLAELGQLCTDALFELARPIEVAYFVDADLAARTFTFSSQRTAADIPSLPENCQPFSSVHDAEEVLVRGEIFSEFNLPASRHSIFRERAKTLGSGRFISAGVKADNFDGAIGYIQKAPEPHTERERQRLGLFAEIVHLALSSRT